MGATADAGIAHIRIPSRPSGFGITKSKASSAIRAGCKIILPDILRRISVLIFILYDEMIKPARNSDAPPVVEPMSDNMLSISFGKSTPRSASNAPNSGAHTIGLAKLLASPFQINPHFPDGRHCRVPLTRFGLAE